MLPPEAPLFPGVRPPLIEDDLSGRSYIGTLGPVTVVGRIAGTDRWWVTASCSPSGSIPGLAGPVDDPWLRYFLRVGPRPECHSQRSTPL